MVGELSNGRQGADFMANVALGRVSGSSFIQVSGFNGDIDVGSQPEELIPWGGRYAWQAAPVAMQVVSTSANDAAAGTGLRTVLIRGILVDGGPEVTETVTLNGLTPVATVNNYYRINGFTGVLVGSGGFNAGDVSIRTTAGAVIQAQIPIGQGRSQAGVYTVPAGFTAALVDYYTYMQEFVGTQSFVNVQLYTRTTGTVWVSRNTIVMSQGTASRLLQPRQLGVVPAGTDIMFTGVTVNNNNTQVGVFASFLLTPVP